MLTFYFQQFIVVNVSFVLAPHHVESWNLA